MELRAWISMNKRHRIAGGKPLSCVLIPGIASLLVLLSFCPCGAEDCEILRADKYQKSQEVIVTDWKDGIPYRKYTTEIYRCAEITFRNDFWQALYSSDIEVTATFGDGNAMSKNPACEKKLLQPGDTYSCGICFETDSPISGLSCRFR